MSLDLRLLPQYNQNADFSHDIIGLQIDEELTAIMQNLEKTGGREVPRRGINSFIGEEEGYEGNCYGKTTTTPYGEVMIGVLAKEMKKALIGYKPEGWKNKAALAFVNHLPDELEIWLYWH